MAGTRRRKGLRAGFGIVDLLVTIAIMGIVTSGAFTAVIAYTRAFHIQRGRVIAQILAHNEAEVLRTTGPSIGVGTDTMHTDETFASNPNGAYEIITSRDVDCVGGTTVHYNDEAPDPITGCGAARPMLVATVTVYYATDDTHKASLAVNTVVGQTTLPVPRLSVFDTSGTSH